MRRHAAPAGGGRRRARRRPNVRPRRWAWLLLLGALAGAPAPAGAGDHPEGDGRDAHEHDDGGAPHAGEARTFSVAELEAFGVRLATAGPGEVDVAIELPGEVRPNADRLAHIAPRFPGIVREVRARVGDAVRAGDVLAVIESERLSTFPLTAAFDGTVLDRHIAPGEAVDPEEPAFIVADLTTVWVEISVHQRALPLVRVGGSVWIAASHGEAEAEGTIAYVAPIVDQATRTATARVVLPNPAGLWRPGLFVDATVMDPVPAEVVVSRRALQTLAGATVVFVAEGTRFAPHPVTVGRVGRTRAEIRAGLAAGARYADERAFLVKAELGKGASGPHEH